MAALRSGESAVTVKTDADGNPELHYPGDYNTAVPGHRDIAYRQSVLEREGVTTQIVSLTTPGTHVETPARAVKYASMVNDEFAKDVQERSPRFAAYATLPLNDPKASVVEFRRAVEQLHFPGAMLFSNVNGVALADERYWPLYEAADELGAVLHIHPTNPINVEAMREYWLMPLVGFLFDTTVAAAHLVFSGVNERFPRIKWVASHLGGALPYLAERLDRGYEAFPECRANISKPPSAYLRDWYYDTVNFDPRAIELAVQFAGAGHILAGSDYPHAIGSIPLMMKALKELQLSEQDRAAIFGGNAAKLYNLG
jgi:aminocarboxymuconate-semialdehyde decarboxylase